MDQHSQVESKQLLVMMLGSPGAGKSYFARNLAEQYDMRRVNADAVRTRLFGSINAGRTPENHKKTYETVDREMEEALRQGRSVIRDNQNNHEADRAKARGIAVEVGALAVVVWIKTPREVAVKRMMERPETPEQLQLDEQTAQEFIDSSHAALEEPGADEPCVVINGQIPFEDQLALFQDFLQNVA